jgi:Carboxypeptidase regulatory-like domain
MIRALAFALVAAMPAAAAVIRGSVVENFTGKLLARAVVVLEPMPGTPAVTLTVRTTRLGAFEFDNLPAGVYVLKASRRGFIPIQHGQKRWNSAGQPLAIEDAATAYITLRLPRLSAISGTIVDENEIGLPGHEVAVYRAKDPPEHIRDATADDRGVYRIGGLEPGKYLVRTVARQYEEGGYLPTFSRETIRPDQAQTVEVLVENQVDNVDVRPLPGKLFSLTVEVDVPNPDTVLTLASGIWRKTIKSPGSTFPGLPQGEYEVYAESSEGGGAYQRLILSEDRKVALLWGPPVGVSVTGGPSRDAGFLRMRRKDLAGVGQEVRVPVREALLPAGRWELLLEPPEGYYVSSTMPYGRRRPEGWVEVESRPRFSFGYRLSGGAAAIRGVVKDAPYAPVFLEGYDRFQKQRVGDLKVVHADAWGRFRFGSLAPGTYRLLSTFEYLNPDTETIDAAGPATVMIEESREATKEIELWVIR